VRRSNGGCRNEAKYSLPYCLALAFLNIPITAQHFQSNQVNADAVAFAQKISWTTLLEADFPNKFEAEIKVQLRDGQTVFSRVDQVKGSASRPASQDEIKTKFMGNTSSISDQQGIIDFLLQGETDLPITQLGSLLRGS
jgi:2-methylcitrate dehydratase PrpD